MTAAWNVVILVLELIQWLVAPPGSLAEASFRESLRREAIGPAVASLSDATLPARVEAAVDGTALPQPRSSESSEREEAAWRAKVRDLQLSMTNDLEEIARTTSRLAGLERDAIARDDPAQQAELRRQAQQARQSIAQLGRRLAATKGAIEQLQEEARRLNIPPGWLR